MQEPPEPPGDIFVDSKSSRTVALRWEPGYDGNNPLIDFIINLKELLTQEEQDMQENIGLERNVTVNHFSAVIRNLRPAYRYKVVVYARNSVGISHSSRPIEVLTDEEAPGGPPTNIRLTALDTTTIKVDWLPPRPDLVNGQVKGYYIGYRIFNTTDHFIYKTVQPQNSDTGDSAYSLIVERLKPYTHYAVILQAFNNVGAGPRSDEIVSKLNFCNILYMASV